MTSRPADTADARETVGSGEVFDLGYQHYEGAREGRWRPRKAIWRDGVRTTLGLGRSATAKILPFLFIGLTLLPAVVMIVILGFVSTFGGDTSDAGGPTFPEYYEWAFVFIMLFAATVAPELLCTDRRTGVIGLYLVRPLTATDYVAARWAAFLAVSLAALWFPQAMIFVWSALTASQPLDWVGSNWDAAPRFMAAGGVIAVVLTTLSMSVASFTNRRLYAAVGTLGLILVTGAVAGIGEETVSGPGGDWFSLLNLPGSTLAVSDRIFGEQPNMPLSTASYAASLAGIVAVSASLLWWRYRTLRL